MRLAPPGLLVRIAQKRHGWSLTGAGLLVALGVVLWAGARGRHGDVRPSPDEDPRRSYPTPYRNVRPEVAYVGDEVCAACHGDLAESYHRHPMGRSLAPVAEAPASRAAEATPSFSAGGFEYAIERRGRQLFHKELRRDAAGKPIYELAIPVRYVLGSGTRGRAYLIDRDGYLFQSPISWYAQKQRWDLSPGYQEFNRHFDRLIRSDCLFCHSNRADPVEGSLGHYQEPVFRGYAIGCERCHGPGELHVARRQHGDLAEGPDDTIVNPARLEPALREAICQQCHVEGEVRVPVRGRQPFDYRPGLPLDRFVAVFVRPAAFTDHHKVVSHVEQMYASRCFQAAGGRLGCISCHDPHAQPAPAERAAYYRTRCLACHQETSCALPPAARRRQQPEDACTACHMPRLSELDIAHTALTDHRIPRRADAATPAGAPEAWPGAAATPLVRFHADPADSGGGDASRDLGLALVRLAEHGADRAASRRLEARALPLLETALGRDPEDVDAWHAKALALRTQGQKEEALAALEAGLVRAPAREESLVEAADLAADLGRDQAALAYWRRALEVNPWSADTQAALARFLAVHRQWQAAAEHGRAALELQPSRVGTRGLLVGCYLALGQRDRARAEFERVLAFGPPNPAKLRRWFEEQLRHPPAALP